jgi:chemotaxis protein histidine kinase CheA
MDFQDYAAKETAAAVARALAESSEGSRQRLQSFRSAINAATKALETALSSTQQIDLTELVARLAKAATADTEAAVQRSKADAKASADRSVAEAKAAADALQTQLKAAVKEKDALSASLAESRARADQLRVELQADKDNVETSRRELTSAREAQKKAEAARAEAIAEREKDIRARAVAEEDLQKAQADVDKMRSDVEKILADADRARTDASRIREESAGMTKALNAARADKERLEEALNAALSQTQTADAKLGAVTSLFKASAARVKTLERAQAEHDGAVRDLEEQLATARTLFDEKLAAIKDLQEKLAAAGDVKSTAADRGAATASLMADLLGGFRALASATTIADVLTALVRGLSKEFARVALFRVKGNRLEGQEHLGFDSKTDIAKVVMPLGMDSLLTRAVASGGIERLTGSDLKDTSRAPFGGTPTCALALPIVVHGDALGIVYADNSGSNEKDSATAHDLKTRFADALVQHGVALLTRLTTELRTLAELRAYASSLLSEMEQMYVSDVNAGKSGPELQKRLKDNLEYARSIYANRIALECPDAATLLDDQLAVIAEEQQGTPFGRDLALVAGEDEASGQSRRTAS